MLSGAPFFAFVGKGRKGAYAGFYSLIIRAGWYHKGDFPPRNLNESSKQFAVFLFM